MIAIAGFDLLNFKLTGNSVGLVFFCFFTFCEVVFFKITKTKYY